MGRHLCIGNAKLPSCLLTVLCRCCKSWQCTEHRVHTSVCIQRSITVPSAGKQLCMHATVSSLGRYVRTGRIDCAKYRHLCTTCGCVNYSKATVCTSTVCLTVHSTGNQICIDKYRQAAVSRHSLQCQVDAFHTDRCVLTVSSGRRQLCTLYRQLSQMGAAVFSRQRVSNLCRGSSAQLPPLASAAMATPHCLGGDLYTCPVYIQGGRHLKKYVNTHYTRPVQVLVYLNVPLAGHLWVCV